MPKISVRVVPEASTSASMRPLRSAIFLSSVRTSRSTSEVNRRRRRAEAPSWAVCRAGGARPSRPRASGPPRRGGGPAGARGGCLSALVRSATRSSRLSESRRSASDAASGSTAASRPLREAAGWRGHLPRRSCGHCRSRAPAPALRAWAGRPPPTRRPQPASPPGDRPRPLAFSTAQRRSGRRLAQRSRDPRPSRFCGKAARSRSSPVTSSTAATATDALWGSTPMSA